IAAGLLLESFLLTLLGCALGLALAYGALRVLVATAPTGLPRINEIAINGPAVFFTLVISLFVSLLFGCVPAFTYAGVPQLTALRESGRSMSESRHRHRARSALVVFQVALALVLLVSAGLMIRTFRALIEVDPGFFKTLGTPLVAGRDLTWSDIYNKVPVAIVSERMAREYWRDPASALGKQIRVSPKDDWRQIVGVVGDVRDDGVDKEAPSSVYW